MGEQHYLYGSPQGRGCSLGCKGDITQPTGGPVVDLKGR